MQSVTIAKKRCSHHAREEQQSAFIHKAIYGQRLQCKPNAVLNSHWAAAEGRAGGAVSRTL